MAVRNQLSARLKEILVAERETRWKYGRRSGGGGGDRDAEEYADGAGSNGSWDAGTDTGDAQVGE